MKRYIYFLDVRGKVIDYDISAILHALGSSNILVPVQSIDEIPQLDKENVFIGSVNQMERALGKFKLNHPTIDDFPDDLDGFFGRKIEKSTWEKLEQKKGIFFVKPVSKGIFEPFCSNFPMPMERRLGYLHIHEKVSIWVQQVVNIEHEFRCFVMNGEIIDVRQYRGKWDVRPSELVITSACRNFKTDFPCYCMDVGITDDNKTIVIEINNGICFGAYGLMPGLAAKMWLATWDHWSKNW